MAERKEVEEPVIIITFDIETREPIIKTHNVNYHQMKVAGQDLFTVGDEMHRAALRDEMHKAMQQQMAEAQKKAQEAAMIAQVAADIKKAKK